jgi:hypothetical protein
MCLPTSGLADYANCLVALIEALALRLLRLAATRDLLVDDPAAGRRDAGRPIGPHDRHAPDLATPSSPARIRAAAPGDWAVAPQDPLTGHRFCSCAKAVV